MILSTARQGKFTYRIQDESHTILSDVSKESGGDDLGMSPHTLAEAALAACTAITLQMYADHKKIPLESADVRVRILSEGNPNHMAVELKFKGDLSEDQRTRLLQIAGRCPIHKFLTAPTEITTTLLTS